MSKIFNIRSAISSVLKKNQTDKERENADHRIEENDENSLFFNRLDGVRYNNFIEEKALADKERVYAKTEAKIKEAKLKLTLHIWRHIAAASVALLLIIGGLHIFDTEPSALTMVESHCLTGSITKLVLSDGSTVTLNANSTISYPQLFETGDRIVKLNGEAYFEIRKDAKRPFVVETQNMRIKVLGTHFNVKSYENEDKVMTTLLEGSVSVEVNEHDASTKKAVLLVPGQQLTLDKTAKTTKIAEVNSELYTLWLKGQCFFENERFIDIIKMLERRFGVNIRIISPNLENQLYSGFFGEKDNVTHILNSFKKYRDFDYIKNDTGIEIYEK